MPIASTATIKFSPQGILHSKWIHDMAKHITVVRLIALRADGLLPFRR